MNHRTRTRGDKGSNPSQMPGKANSKRKSPLESATEFEHGVRKRGLDGNLWEILEYKKKDGTVVKRWKRAPDDDEATDTARSGGRGKRQTRSRGRSRSTSSNSTKAAASKPKASKKKTGRGGKSQPQSQKQAKSGSKSKKSTSEKKSPPIVDPTTHTIGAMRCGKTDDGNIACVYVVCKDGDCYGWREATMTELKDANSKSNRASKTGQSSKKPKTKLKGFQ